MLRGSQDRPIHIERAMKTTKKAITAVAMLDAVCTRTTIIGITRPTW